MLYDRIAWEKHIYVATKAERIQNPKHRVLSLNEDLSNHAINDLTLLKRQEKAKDCTMSTWQGPKKKISIPRSQQVRQRKGQQFEGNEKYDCTVDPKKQVGGSTMGRGPSCRQLRHKCQRGTKPIGRRAIGILSIPQALTGQISVAWRITSSQPMEDVNRYTQKCSTCRAAQHDRISSREHARVKHCKDQDCTSVLLKQVSSTCHVPFLAAPNTDHKHKFSLTQFSSTFLFRSDSPTNTHKIFGTVHTYPAMFHGRVEDQHKTHLSQDQDNTAGPGAPARWQTCNVSWPSGGYSSSAGSRQVGR